MKINYDEIKRLFDYENLVVVDDKGVIIFFDFADLGVLKAMSMDPDNIIGKKITAVWKDLTDETSTLMRVVKSGIPICNNRQKHQTLDGKFVYAANSTFPLVEDGRIVGAIEFNKFYFTKDNSKFLDDYAPHKIFRKNNTIYTIDDIITENPRMMEIKSRIGRIAGTDSSVLIFGQTGTGKEVIAQSIHNMSARYSKPFISQNCGAIPATLLESILFGTVKGSFTGSEDTKGLFEIANGGTLFLDEINSMDISLQVKLLRAIELKTIRRVGSTRDIHLDIRIISATNENPEIAISQKRLRADLFYRLGAVQINLPSLSERKEDIGIMTDFFIKHFNRNMKNNIKSIHPDVMECFYEYDWPGNLRELRNAIETAFNNAAAEQITIDDIPERISICGIRKAHKADKEKLKSLRELTEEYEKQILVKELRNAGGKHVEAAKRLDISKQLLNFKMNKYKLK
ncbi:MAG: sigma 54-interacting transcriptional regulator [Clostridiaceae bacterium]|nr:sigma 54-interacting transcriptional regulator [Clostridiaceae bacterium]